MQKYICEFKKYYNTSFFWVFWLSVEIIIFGGYIFAHHQIFETNSLIVILFSKKLRLPLNQCCIGWGISYIVIGAFGIFIQILKYCQFARNCDEKCNKFALILYFSNSVLLCVGMILIYAVIRNYLYGLENLEENFCKGDKILSIVKIYNSIVSSNQQHSSCPSNCPSSTTKSLKLANCKYYLDLFRINISDYNDTYFNYISNFEFDFNCSGLCKYHLQIKCTYF